MATRITLNIDKTGLRAADVLAERSGLSKGRLKDAMNKGAVQLCRRGKWQRLRRVTAELQLGDQLQLHYDEQLLARQCAAPVLLADERRYSLWYKPAGMLAQGNEWGDHCALTRAVELHFSQQRSVFVVHRLDREARGLMLVAHDAEASAKLSALFQGRLIKKQYQISVCGELPEQGTIDTALDGKNAMTTFVRHAFDVASHRSLAIVMIDSGRKHQIRRHFAGIDHPVSGDPLYGENNHDSRGMQLVAVQLHFFCPIKQKQHHYELPQEWRLF